jgi:ABC-2 type transport system ATP-binding protein
VIAVEGLTKRFGRRTVLDGVSFTCPPGTVTGFLGRNGAGKSTTLRILAGFSRADKGRALFDGKRYAELAEPAQTVGTMLDASVLHSGRTARETLRLQARATGSDPGEAVALLDAVGLGGSAQSRVGSFSLGMRQRLGIAVALVGGPRILVLDEPYNGLDPEGVFWIRGLLRAFADEGGVALLSSHLLNEVREAVDRVVLLERGVVVAEGDLSALLRGETLTVRAAHREHLTSVLDKHGLHWHGGVGSGVIVTADANEVSQILFEERVHILELTPATGSVEDLYFSLTGEAP